VTALRIERVTEADDELVEAVARLVPQLSPGARPPTRAELAELVAQPHVWLLAARAGDGVVGMLALILYRIPTGTVGWIEDVVVDEAARGRGVGEALTREAQRIGAERGVHGIGLTSRPDREAANRLYPRLGFVRRETNVYVWRPQYPPAS
jgi:ribosomal protein S18 acetylase RimI-like enzyme